MVFYFLWVKNEDFNVPTDSFKIQYNFDNKTSYFQKMKILLNDFQNHNFWINEIGFDGYCYLLFMRKMLITLMAYAFLYGIGSLIFYILEDIMSLGFIEDTNFNKTATHIYFIVMVFFLSSLVLIMIKDYRR